MFDLVRSLYSLLSIDLSIQGLLSSLQEQLLAYALSGLLQFSGLQSCLYLYAILLLAYELMYGSMRTDPTSLLKDSLLDDILRITRELEKAEKGVITCNETVCWLGGPDDADFIMKLQGLSLNDAMLFAGDAAAMVGSKAMETAQLIGEKTAEYAPKAKEIAMDIGEKAAKSAAYLGTEGLNAASYLGDKAKNLAVEYAPKAKEVGQEVAKSALKGAVFVGAGAAKAVGSFAKYASNWWSK